MPLDTPRRSHYCSHMPSVHKRLNSPFWVAAFDGADGRRLKKSTRTSNRTLAMKLALEWEQAAKAGRAGRLVESQCRRVLSEIHEHANGEALQFYTAGAWLEEWLAGKKGAVTPRTRMKYDQYVAEFRESLGDRDKAPLNAINIRDIRKFRDELAKEGHSPVTVNGALKILAAPFNAALRLGYVTTSPCSGVEPLRDDADVEKDVFTPDQLRALIDSAEGDWKGMIRAAFYTGLRLGDLANLQWEHFNLEAKVPTMRRKTSKKQKIVSVPIHADFAQWLSEQTRGIGKAPLFPSLFGKSGAGRNGLSMAFSAIMERAGVVGRILRQAAEGSAGRTQRSLTFHSLRHSFNSAMANAGVSQELRQKLTGHASATMNARYTHHELQVLESAVAKLPSIAESA